MIEYKFPYFTISMGCEGLKQWKKNVTSIGLSLSLIGTGLTSVLAESPVTKSSLSFKNYLEEGKKAQNKYDLIKKKNGELSSTEFIVKYSKPLSKEDHTRAGTTLVRKINGLKYDIVKLQKGKKPEEVIKNYQEMNQVVTVTPSATFVPYSLPDPKVSKQYHLSLLKIAEAQKLAGKNKVKVAVIDGGVDTNHPELKKKMLPTYNTTNPLQQAMPDFHGTHVAGIIASEKNNGVGGYGINPNTSILSIDVFGRGWGASDYTVAEGILYAVEQKADVINMSLGSSYPSPLIKEAVQKALDAGIPIIASAGNSGMNELNYPAAFEGVISVGSTNKDNKLSSYSTYGPSVDLVAPGEAVYAPLYDYEKGSTFYSMSGTSMSAPVVTGVASLLLSKYPNLTPKQIEYILEESAKDLGSQGYDILYGAGLVDPVAALKFDVKKIPASVSVVKNKDGLLKASENLTLGNRYKKIKDNIRKPYEEKFYKVDLKKGESIQTTLKGAANYDYQLSFYMIDQKDVAEPVVVNQVAEGKTEGHLYTAGKDGTLVISVGDANGNYHGGGKSNFTLQAMKLAELPADTNTVENPTVIKEIPYRDSSRSNTFIGEDGDSDYFSIIVDEPQKLKINLSGVAGIDSTIAYYLKEEMPEFPEELSEEERKQWEEEWANMALEPMEIINNKGIGESETLYVEAYPEAEIIVEVNNHTSSFFGFFDPYMDQNKEVTFPSSALLYTLKVNAIDMPEDEDGFPLWNKEDEMHSEENVTVEDKVKAQFHDHGDGEEEEELDMVSLVREMAPEYDLEEGTTGYLQTMDDEDWFKLTPSANGVYEFDFSNSGAVPIVEIVKVVEMEDETYFEPVSHNVTFDWWSIKGKENMFAGLSTEEEYYLRIASPEFQLTSEPYSIKSKLVIDGLGDANEPNDSLTGVKDMKGQTVKGNFSLSNDLDVFYVKAQQSGIYGVDWKPLQLTAEQKKKYPTELQQPLDGVVVVLKDLNGNRALDEEEYGTESIIDINFENEGEQGAFKSEKGKGYFIVTLNYSWEPVPNMIPYQLSVMPFNLKDEDAGSTVKNNIPSKPLSLKKSSKTWESKGYLNAGVPYGDSDWYQLSLDSTTKGSISFDFELVDGVIELYGSNGKLVAKSNNYANGDGEMMYFNLKKGNYFIKVRDVHGNASITPYQLKVMKN
jgi:subtilisin family serine protease